MLVKVMKDVPESLLNLYMVQFYYHRCFLREGVITLDENILQLTAKVKKSICHNFLTALTFVDLRS